MSCFLLPTCYIASVLITGTSIGEISYHAVTPNLAQVSESGRVLADTVQVVHRATSVIEAYTTLFGTEQKYFAELTSEGWLTTTVSVHLVAFAMILARLLLVVAVNVLFACDPGKVFFAHTSLSLGYTFHRADSRRPNGEADSGSITASRPFLTPLVPQDERKDQLVEPVSAHEKPKCTISKGTVRDLICLSSGVSTDRVLSTFQYP